MRRLSGGRERLTMFVMMPPASPEWPYTSKPGFSYTEELKKGGYSEGTVGAVETFFLRADEGPWTDERLAALAPVDVVLRLSHDRAKARSIPASTFWHRVRVCWTSTLSAMNMQRLPSAFARHWPHYGRPTAVQVSARTRANAY